MFSKGFADAVQRYRVYAGVGVGQAEPDDPENVPVQVEIVAGRRVEVEPKGEHVVWEETDYENYDEG